MISRVDWISFTLSIDPVGQERWKDLYASVYERLGSALAGVVHIVFDGQPWHGVMGRAPYTHAWRRLDNGITIYASPTQPHMLIEMTGTGCAALHESAEAGSFLERVAKHLTRLDLAADMLCKTSPAEFTQARETKRFKAWSEMVSETGHTVYVGSRQSDRYARVYRYYAPHPRSEFLRAEHVLRREQAKAAAERILDVGLWTVISELGNSFGWRHAEWQPDIQTAAELRAWRPERAAGNTVRWVYAQVAPALLKLDAEGNLDVRNWFETEILPKLQSR